MLWLLNAISAERTFKTNEENAKLEHVPRGSEKS